MNKDFDSMLVVSEATLRASGLMLEGAETHEIAVRGREGMLTVHVVKERLVFSEIAKPAA
jgi:hypothetical protein